MRIITFLQLATVLVYNLVPLLLPFPCPLNLAVVGLVALPAPWIQRLPLDFHCETLQRRPQNGPPLPMQHFHLVSGVGQAILEMKKNVYQNQHPKSAGPTTKSLGPVDGLNHTTYEGLDQPTESLEYLPGS